MSHEVYHSPFDGRYTSTEMNRLFSDDKKFGTWRRLWVALAKAEKELGLPITAEQIAEMELHLDDINYDVAAKLEREIRHDVMAHIRAYGEQAPTAAGIIHLGATSCYVTDNTDILIMWDAIGIIRGKLLGVISLLADFAGKYRALPTLGYTHYQPATPTTVGKRATLWLQNFMENLRELDFVAANLKMLGCRGATGSSETFMELFHGDESKCAELEHLIAEQFGFTDQRITKKGDPHDPFDYDDIEDAALVYPVSGQTYPRNLDFQVLNALAAIAASAYKFAQDLRLLQHDKELEEPFAKNQVGSSAMAYKRNPMRSERICSLSRYLGGLPAMAWQTAATQMLERTLDDSAGRRIYVADAFRAADAILILCNNVAGGIVVNEAVIATRLDAEVPFMATEAMIMRAVENGADRQQVHARIREHSLEVGKMVKTEGLPGSEVKSHLVDRIAKDPAVPLTVADIEALLDPTKLTGCSALQVTEYLENSVYPLLEKENGGIVVDATVNV